MKHDFNSFDLIRFLYNEMSYLESLALQQALRTREDLRLELQELRISIQHIPSEKSFSEPELHSLERIRNYSKNTNADVFG